MEKGVLIHRRGRVTAVLVGAEGENFGEADMKAVRIELVNLPEGGVFGTGRDRHAAIPVFTRVKQQLFLLKRFLGGQLASFPFPMVGNHHAAGGQRGAGNGYRRDRGERTLRDGGISTE